MSGKIVAINCSPRKGWNTDMLVSEAARGAEANRNAVEKYDLYRLEHFTGCISCFGCKKPGHEGICVCRDGLAPVLDAIRDADGLIFGTPIYFGNMTAGFRALFERLLFPYITYQKERMSCNKKQIPVLLIVTSNVPTALYPLIGYKKMIRSCQRNLKAFVGPTTVLTCGETQQVADSASTTGRASTAQSEWRGGRRFSRKRRKKHLRRGKSSSNPERFMRKMAMNKVICVFSGTGNSRYVAKQIADMTGDSIVNRNR